MHREVFSEVWTTVRDQFFDPDLGGVDWNGIRDRYGRQAAEAADTAELSRAINAMLGELGTSHTAYYTASDPAYYQLAAIFQVEGLGEPTPNGRERIYPYPSIGILTSMIDGRTFVRAVFPPLEPRVRAAGIRFCT